MILYIMNMMTVQWYPISIIILLNRSSNPWYEQSLDGGLEAYTNQVRHL